MSILTAAQIANRRRWAQALESSRQAQHNLADDAGRECCLGVACRVLAGKTRGEMVWRPMPSDVGVPLARLTGARDKEQKMLADANDNVIANQSFPVSGMTHREIALYLYLTAEAGIA